MCAKCTVPETLIANVTAPEGSLIILSNNDECNICHNASPDRAHYACPTPGCDCHFCGHCAVIEPLAARMAECPKCHNRYFWPK